MKVEVYKARHKEEFLQRRSMIKSQNSPFLIGSMIPNFWRIFVECRPGFSQQRFRMQSSTFG